MREHDRCPVCGAGVPRGAAFCPACGTAVDASDLRIEPIAVGSMVTEHEDALGARRPNRRSALVVGAVTLVVVGAGLAVGTGSGDDGDAPGTSSMPTTTIAPQAATEGSTPTTRPAMHRTTTTSTVPTYTGKPIPELAGAALYAVIGGRVVRIDSTTGEAVVLAGGERVAPDDSRLVPRTGGVVVVPGGTPRFVPDDGAPVVTLRSGESTPDAFAYADVWPAADPALVWLVHDSVVRLVRASSGETVATVQVPRFSYPLGDDGTGRLLVAAETGGTFAINPASGAVERFSDAKIVAATPTHLLQFRCDDALVCGHEVADRATGLATTVPIDPVELNPGGPLDPTGMRAVLVKGSYPLPRLLVVDLDSGAQTELGFTETFTPGVGDASWTADGSHLVTARAGAIAVWSAATDQVAEYRLSVDHRTATVTTVVLAGPRP